MPETPLRAVGSSAGTTTPQQKWLPARYISMLYVAVGVIMLVFGLIIVGSTTFNVYVAAVNSIVALIIIALGFMDYKNTKSGKNSTMYAWIFVILGIIVQLMYVNQYYAPPLAPLEWVGVDIKGSVFYLADYHFQNYLDGESYFGLLMIIGALYEVLALRRAKTQ
jgi:hypothetical protein